MIKRDKKISFTSLALALASDYNSLYVVDSQDDSYVEYAPSGADKDLIPISNGDKFFEDVPQNVEKLVWPEDQSSFLDAFQKEAMLHALENGLSFSHTYRLVVDGKPRYYFLKAIQADDYIVIGVRDIDVQKRRELENEAAGIIYGQIAQSLASRYEVIYYISTVTNEYTIYSSSKQYAKLGTTKHGADFFQDANTDIRRLIHPDDVEVTLEKMDKHKLLRRLQKKGVVSLSYRQILNGRYQYMNMLVVQPRNAPDHIVIGVLNTNEEVLKEQSIKEQNRTFGAIALALAERYEVIYYVNTVTNEYIEYSTSEKYSKLNVGARGKDFFGETQANMRRDIYPDDLPMMAKAMDKETLLRSLSAYGKTILNYRLMLDDRPQYVSLYAVRPKDNPDYIIVSIANIDEAKRMELAYEDAMDLANKDALTGVKNKRAYVQTEAEMDEEIDKKTPFAMVVCDLNGLKQVNDTQGHKAGDDYIRKACAVICNVFDHSPVFRIGGDEFAVILKGRDYERREKLIQELKSVLEEEKHLGIPLLAFGISDYDPLEDNRVQDVFERADNLMYENKEQCKKR